MKTSITKLLLSLIWTLMILTMIVNNDTFTYVAFIVSGIAIICYGLKGGFVFRKYQTQINVCFLAILTFELIGLFFQYSTGSLRGIIAIIAIMILFNSSIWGYYNGASHKTLLLVYWVSLLYLCVSNTIGQFGNSLCGALVFFLCSAIFFAIQNYNKAINKVMSYILSFTALLTTVYVSYNASARTALLTTLLISVGYLVLVKKKVTNSSSSKGFFLLLGITIAIIYIYSHISSYTWYRAFNTYSIRYFGKNIDSSRPQLWIKGIEATKNNIFFGIGTGARPRDIGLRWDSFHNSFIQIYVQNGLLALIPAINIFRIIWTKMRHNIEDNSIKFMMVCYIGIVFFNCFEATLFNNKVSLGAIQWFLMAIACAKCDILETKSRGKRSK